MPAENFDGGLLVPLWASAVGFTVVFATAGYVIFDLAGAVFAVMFGWLLIAFFVGLRA